MSSRYLRLRRGTTPAAPDATPPAAGPAAAEVTGPGWTPERLRALGDFTTIRVAADIYQVSRSAAYANIRADLSDGGARFPVRALRVGGSYRIPVAAILAERYPHTSPGPDPETGAGGEQPPAWRCPWNTATLARALGHRPGTDTAPDQAAPPGPDGPGSDGPGSDGIEGSPGDSARALLRLAEICRIAAHALSDQPDPTPAPPPASPGGGHTDARDPRDHGPVGSDLMRGAQARVDPPGRNPRPRLPRHTRS